MLTLLAALVVTPLVLFLLPSPASAPPAANDLDGSTLGRDHGTPLQRPPQDDKRPRTTPGTDPVPSNPPRTVPDIDTDPVPDQRAARLRVIDAATGEPVANTPVRFGLLAWYSDTQAAELERVPFDPEDSDYRAAVTDATGECELPVTGADLRDDDPLPLYPLPPGWLPETTPAELWPEIVRIIKAGGVAEVRIRRGVTLRVVCTHGGVPLPGVRVFAAPHEDAQLPEGLPDANWDDSREMTDLYARYGDTGAQQSGSGEPEGVTFEASGYLPEDFVDLVPPEFWAETGDDGVAIFTLPPMVYTVTAMAGLLPMKSADVVLTAESEVLFEFEQRARVRLTIVWLDTADPPTFYQFNALDGMLDVLPAGHRRCTVSVEAVRIGAHECVHLVDGEPEFGTWFEILPGDNEITIYLGEAALCEWSAELVMDGARLEEFKLAYRHADQPAMPFEQWPATAAFSGHETVRVRPGRYVVHAPDDTTQEIEFPPGGQVYSRFVVSLREVTFTIAEDLWDALTPDCRDTGIGLDSFGWGDKNNSVLELAVIVAGVAGDGLRSLKPGSPVILRLPPGVYSIDVDLPGSGAFNFALDLRDPALNEVHLTLDGWPGLARYTVRHDGESGLAPADTGPWDFEYCFFDSETRSWTGYYPPGGMLCNVWVGNKHRAQAWLPHASDYTVDAPMYDGPCSIGLTGAELDDDYAWTVHWKRGGVYFWNRELDHEDGAERLPTGPVTVRICRVAGGKWDDRVYATATIDLSSDHLIDVTTLKWEVPGTIRVLGGEGADVSLQWGGGYGWSLGPGPLPLGAGEYYAVIEFPSGTVEIRTVTVRAGHETVIDLR